MPKSTIIKQESQTQERPYLGVYIRRVGPSNKFLLRSTSLTAAAAKTKATGLMDVADAADKPIEVIIKTGKDVRDFQNSFSVDDPAA